MCSEDSHMSNFKVKSSSFVPFYRPAAVDVENTESNPHPPQAFRCHPPLFSGKQICIVGFFGGAFTNKYKSWAVGWKETFTYLIKLSAAWVTKYFSVVAFNPYFAFSTTLKKAASHTYRCALNWALLSMTNHGSRQPKNLRYPYRSIFTSIVFKYHFSIIVIKNLWKQREKKQTKMWFKN